MRVKILLCMGGMKSKSGENFGIHFSFFLFGQFVERWRCKVKRSSLLPDSSSDISIQQRKIPRRGFTSESWTRGGFRKKSTLKKGKLNFRQRNQIPDLIPWQIGGIFNFSAWTAFCRVLRMTSCAPVPSSGSCLSVCPYCYSHHWSGACRAYWNYCSRACCCS